MADGKMIEYRIDNGVAVMEINRPPVNSYTTDLLKFLDFAGDHDGVNIVVEARFEDGCVQLLQQIGGVTVNRRAIDFHYGNAVVDSIFNHFPVCHDRSSCS